MSSEQRIAEFLSKNRGQPYCDDCLSKGLAIKPRQQVQQKTSSLGKQRSFDRAAGTCSRCNSHRIVIRAVSLDVHAGSLMSKPAIPLSPNAAGLSTSSTIAKSKHTAAEVAHCTIIETKDHALRAYLANNKLDQPAESRQWLSYLNGMKHVLGNINNDVSFLATLLVKEYLSTRFSITNFDAGEKAQGAPGIDIETHTPDGKIVVGELKTTKPYQPGFGAAQRASIVKDLSRLSASMADHRFMFVIDAEAFGAMAHKSLMSCAPGVEVVNLVTGEAFVCEARQ
jgi:hypothetical protein